MNEREKTQMSSQEFLIYVMYEIFALIYTVKCCVWKALPRHRQIEAKMEVSLKPIQSSLSRRRLLIILL